MDPQLSALLPIGAAVVAAGVTLASFIRYRKKIDSAWKEVAERLGLEHKKGRWGHRSIAGKIGDHVLVIDTITRSSGKKSQTYTRFTLDGRGAFDPGLELKAESAWEGFKKVFAGENLHLDDATFDAAVHVKGPEEVVLAALDEKARLEVLKLVAQRCRVQEGKIYYETVGVLRDAPRMVGLANLMVKAADALRVPALVTALTRNARADSNPGVRRRNLEMLAKRYPDLEETRAALEDALGDPAPENRLWAAGVLRSGPKVREVLETLFDDSRTPVDQRGQVLELMAQCFPYETVSARVAQALDLPSPALRLAAVKAAGRAKDGAPLLARPDLARTTETELGLALAEALKQAGGPAAEPLLLDLLKSEAAPVKAAAAKALGAVGTVRSVEPLLPFTQGLFTDGTLRDEARSAIRGIQSRLGEAQSGGLSVVDERVEEGALSLGEACKAKERG